MSAQTLRILWKQRRLLACWRARTPLLPFVPSFLVGQLAALVLGKVALLALIPLFLLLLLLRRHLAVLASGLTAGMAVALGAAPGLPGPLPDSASSYLIQVTEPVRYPKPGLLQATVQLIARKPPGQKHYVSVEPQSLFVCRAVHLPWKNAASLRQGDMAVVSGKFKQFPAALPPWSYGGNLKRRGVAGSCRITYATRPLIRQEPWLHALRRSIAARVRSVAGDNEDAGLLLSMSLGLRDVLSRATENVFKQTGLAHLLVLSGYQVTLIYYCIYKLLCFLARRSAALMLLFPVERVAAIVALICSCAFVALAGIEASGARAGLALTFAVAASMLERGGGLGGGIVASLLALNIIWPGCFLEPGVQLTYAALLGIFLGQGCSFVVNYILTSVCTSLIVLVWFGQFSIIGFLLNPLLAGLLSVIGCQFVLCGIAMSYLWSGAGGWILRWLGGMLRVVCVGLNSAAALPYAYVQPERIWPYVAVLGGVIVMGVVWRVRQFRLTWNV